MVVGVGGSRCCPPSSSWPRTSSGACGKPLSSTCPSLLPRWASSFSRNASVSIRHSTSLPPFLSLPCCSHLAPSNLHLSRKAQRLVYAAKMCITWLADSVHAIRSAAGENLKKLTEVLGVEWAAVYLIPPVMELCSHSNYLYRITGDLLASSADVCIAKSPPSALLPAHLASWCSLSRAAPLAFSRDLTSPLHAAAVSAVAQLCTVVPKEHALRSQMIDVLVAAVKDPGAVLYALRVELPPAFLYLCLGSLRFCASAADAASRRCVTRPTPLTLACGPASAELPLQCVQVHPASRASPRSPGRQTPSILPISCALSPVSPTANCRKQTALQCSHLVLNANPQNASGRASG